MHYSLVSVNLQVHIVVNNFSVPVLCHIPSLPCQVRVLLVSALECRDTVLGAYIHTIHPHTYILRSTR